MGRETGGLQRAEDRRATSKRELQTLRNGFMQDSAAQGVALEELAKTFSLSEEWVATGILRGVPYRKREKGENTLTALEINDLKLSFACLMGQQGYTIEQCNYMMNLTSEGDYDRQQRQAELEKKYIDLAAKHKRVVRNANKKLAGLEQQLENSAASYKEQAKQLTQQNLAIEALAEQLKEAQKAEPVVDTGEIESLKAELEALRQQLQEKDSEIASKYSEIASLKERVAGQEQEIITFRADVKAEFAKRVTAERKSARERVQAAEGQVAEVEGQVEGLSQAKAEVETEIYIAQGQIYALEAEKLQLLEKLASLQRFKATKAPLGRRLTREEEEKVLVYLKKHKSKVTAKVLKGIEKILGFSITRQAIYALLKRYKT